MSTKEPRIDDSGNSEPTESIQTAKDTKTGRFIVRKEYSGERAKNVAGQVLLVPGKNQKAGEFSHRYSFPCTES